MRPTRRTVLAALTVGLAMPAVTKAQARPRIVIVGGGAGGATVARRLAIVSAGQLEVTLVQETERYVSCFFSNHVIAGLRDMASITQSYDRLAAAGVRKITARATAVDRDRRQVRIDGATLDYDRLVLAPGIDIRYDSIDGYSEAAAQVAPHAWQAGRQTEILIERLAAMQDGDVAVVVSPPNPYRCPPGPYERATVIAHVLKARGFKRSRVIILDHKEQFSKQALFESAWAQYYPGMVEWYGPSTIGRIAHVDVGAGAVMTDFGPFKGALLNIIPAQRSGAIAVQSGLADASGYCPIDPVDFRSRLDPAIHVIGDSAIADPMPKSAFSANSQAKRVAAAIIVDTMGVAREAPALSNTCWSMLVVGDSVKVGARYDIRDGVLMVFDPFISQPNDPPSLRQSNYQDSQRWFDGIVSETFG